MIVKKNFNPIKILPYVWVELLVALTASIIALFINSKAEYELFVPFSISAILGSALAIFVAFRNNNSYARWWEARTLWGGIINSSRVAARLFITFTDSHSHQSNFDKSRSDGFKREMIYLLIAWCHSLRLHLRNQESTGELKQFLKNEDFSLLHNSINKPNYLQLLIGQKLYEAMSNGTLAGFDSFQIEGQLLSLANYQGGCERIKNTPLLRQYHFFTKVFLYIFILIIPFSLISSSNSIQTNWTMAILALIIAFIFSIISKVGEVNEDPFENRITDVPLDALCNTIERELREMLGESEIPAKILAREGYLY